MDDLRQKGDGRILDPVLLDERLEGTLAVAVGVRRPGRVEARGAFAFGVREDLTSWDIDDLRVRVDELPDQPRTGDAVGAWMLTSDPLHRGSSFMPVRVPAPGRVV